MSLSRVAKIFAHDPGPANAAFAYALELKRRGYRIKAYPRGPAIKIFRANIPGMVDSERPQFSRGDLVITGLSGLSSKYELEMIKKARRERVRKIISIMDIPYNLDTRFTIDGKFATGEYLPDEIRVPRIIELSKNENINRLLVEKKNPYWGHVKRKYLSTPPLITNKFVKKYRDGYVLYLTEYFMEQHGNAYGYTEFTVLEDFLNTAKNVNFTTPIFLRLHPVEKKHKYDPLAGKFPGLNIIRADGDLAEFLYYSKAVFGMMSSVFYESVLINKPSYSLQIGAKKIHEDFPEKVKVVSTVGQLTKILKTIRRRDFECE